MSVRDSLTDGLAIIALALAVLQFAAPNALRGVRVDPILLLIFALLVAARRAVRRQMKKRAEMLDSVPKRPLGLSDESADQN